MSAPNPRREVIATLTKEQKAAVAYRVAAAAIAPVFVDRWTQVVQMSFQEQKTEIDKLGLWVTDITATYHDGFTTLPKITVTSCMAVAHKIAVNPDLEFNLQNNEYATVSVSSEGHSFTDPKGIPVSGRVPEDAIRAIVKRYIQICTLAHGMTIS